MYKSGAEHEAEWVRNHGGMARVVEGSILVGLKHPEPKYATFVYAPYIVSTYSPWPLGRIPALSFFSRFGIHVPRPEGWGVLTLNS